MSEIKEVIALSDLKISSIDQIVDQITEYLSYIGNTNGIIDFSCCIVLNNDDSLFIISSDDDLDTYDLSDHENLLDNAEYFSIRELIDSVYSIIKLKKDLSDIVLYQNIEADLLYLF